MQLYINGNYTPNVLHFHGENINQLSKTFKLIFDKYEVNSKYNEKKLSIVSTWTDDEKCVLYQQCKRFGINLINCVPESYDKSQAWYMPNKIRFFLDTLKTINTELVMFLDGYDVLLTNLHNIYDRFKAQKYNILFGPSCNNYPDVLIDRIYGRQNMGLYRYFNAGCVIGYREDLIKFYEEALQYINVSNPLNSEQLIMRHAFKKYAFDKEQTFVGIDYQCKIFQSMGCLKSHVIPEQQTVTLTTVMSQKKYYIVTGSEGFIGKQLVAELQKNANNVIFEVDIKNGIDARNIDVLMSKFDIDCVFHLAAQTSVFNDNLEQIVEDNILTFIKVCKSCNKYGVRLVYTSSSTANRSNTTSLYGLSKRFDEEFAKIYCPTAVGIRLHNVYGETPREGTLFWHLLNDNEVALYNNGKNTRCFTYIDDAIKGIMACEQVNGYSLVNCVNPETLTTKQFADIVKKYNDKVKYRIVNKKREMDNPSQEVDKSIPLINIPYKKVEDVMKMIYGGKE